MKNKWSHYALKDGKIQSSYIREYSNRKKVWKEREPSNCDSNEQGGKEQTKEEIGITHESIGKEKPVETHQQGQQRIQEPVEGRSETEERNIKTNVGEEKMKEKMNKKEKKHEAKESKILEKKEEKREAKKEKKK
jgi:hypothetical protein